MSDNQWSSYSDFYLGSPYSAFPQEHRQSRGKFPFLMVQSQQTPHNFSDPALPETLIALPLSIEKEGDLIWSMNGKRYQQKIRSGSMIVVPANTKSDWEVNVDRTLLVLTLPNSTISTLLGGACPMLFQDLFTPLAQETWENPFIESMIRQLWINSQSQSRMNSFCGDGLVTVIVGQLLLMAGTDIEAHSRIALPAWRLNRVKDYIEKNYSQNIAITDLAEVSGLSVRHFSRSFQLETGETPLNWLMKFRTDKATHLLTTSDRSIGDIAKICGFSSQSHLTTSMKNWVGITPLHWRKLHRYE